MKKNSTLHTSGMLKTGVAGSYKKKKIITSKRKPWLASETFSIFKLSKYTRNMGIIPN